MTLNFAQLPIPSFSPPSYEEVMDEKMKEMNSSIWSNFDKVMEKHTKMKKVLTFFDLPLEIRQRIYNINIEEKLKLLFDRQHYYRKLVRWEIVCAVKEMDRFNEHLDEVIITLPVYLNYSRQLFSIMLKRRFDYARQLASVELDKWLGSLSMSTYNYIFDDVNKLEEDVLNRYEKTINSDSDSDSD